MPNFLRHTRVPLLLLAVAGCSSSGGAAGDGGQSGGANTASGGPNGTGGTGGTGGTAGTGGNMDGGTGGTGASNTSNGGEGGVTNGGNDGGTPPPPCDASKAPDVGTLGLEQVVTGINDLVNAVQPPGSSDWYLVRQSGYIDVLVGGVVRGTSFLDINEDGSTTGATGDERGLLGLAFHPNYASNGLFYVAITTKSDVDEVREYKRSASQPYEADESTEREILALSSTWNHNGGTLHFGPDGMLYVGTGDGGGGCNSDKPGAPQDVSSAFGKILRLDPSKPKPFAAEGNPFATGGDARVWHYGLRNPFRWGFDRVTGDMYIGDVGQRDFEELDVAPKGAKGLNFGWPDYEANAAETCPNAADLREGSIHTPPVFAADRSGNTTPGFSDWNSIIAGGVYRGTALPKLQGAVIFGDYVGDRMAALYQCGNKTSAVTPVNKACDANNPTEACFNAKGSAPDLGQLFAIVEGSDGELYFVGNRSTLYKVVAN